MINQSKNISLVHNEILPQSFNVKFEEVNNGLYPQVKVTLNNSQVGDVIDDNSYENDGYRYHDIFHYTFATLLNWSPCVRAMLKKKRKSNALIDRVEDGARATITEESISLMIFSNAKQNNFYTDINVIDDYLLSTIKNMTLSFEVKSKSKEEWQTAILKSYEVFRLLKENKGGIVKFNSRNKSVTYKNLLST